MSAQHTGPPIIRLENVSKRFVKRLDLAGKIARRLGAKIREEVVHAVDNVNLSIQEGDVLGLVGESGCGKSTLGRMVAGILPLSAGTITYKGQDVAGMSPEAFKTMALNIQMIFQDPFASLNPRKRIGDIIGEAALVHGIVKRAAFNNYLEKIMLRCGLDPSYKRRYPHQFSGGAASAHRHRPGPGRKSRIYRLRRGRSRPGRLDSGPNTQSLHETAGGVAFNLPVHQPRPRGGGAHQ